MCVIVHVPPTVEISKNTLEKCWKANPNGAGLMYATRGALVVRKGMMVFKDFYDEFEKITGINHWKFEECFVSTKYIDERTYNTMNLIIDVNGKRERFIIDVA